MSHFNFENAINEATKMDAPIQRGPLMRWQRKALEAGVKTIALDASLNVSGLAGPRSALTSGKTPNKTPLSAITPVVDRIFLGKTPNKTPGKGSHLLRSPTKTPGKDGRTPSKGSRTPGGKDRNRSKSAPNTPHRGQQDRFIPNRASMDLEMAHFQLAAGSDNVEHSLVEVSPRTLEFQRKMAEALSEGGQVPQDSKILSFKQKPQAREGHVNNLKVLYSTSGKTVDKKPSNSRHIPQQPERIMDAPELLDDYYLNLLSWSTNNHLAIALGSAVYLWNAGNGSITELLSMENPDEYVTSVAWIKEGNILGVGNSLGAVQLWDVAKQKLVRTMGGHAARVGTLSWNSHILSSGSRTGSIHHHDVRVAEHHMATLVHHTQEVCGLAWAPDGRYLASGANDNLVNVWDTALGHGVAPLHTFTDHQAAVKALAWCPWQTNLLASGGGTADRTIRFWSVTTGTCLHSITTNSQVSSIVWSKDHKELVTGHGYSQNQLSIWKYPSMAHITDLTYHSGRILCLAQSPDGSTVASAAADETMCLWKCFAVDKQAKTVTKATKETSKSFLMKGIR